MKSKALFAALFLVFVPVSIYSMEEMEPKIKRRKIDDSIKDAHDSKEKIGSNYFQWLPEEIKNQIAEELLFADRETDAELITRTYDILQGKEGSPITYFNKHIELMSQRDENPMIQERTLVMRDIKTETEKKLLTYTFFAAFPLFIDLCENLDEFNTLPGMFSSSPNLSKILFVCKPNKFQIFDVSNNEKIIQEEIDVIQESNYEDVLSAIAIDNDAKKIAWIKKFNFYDKFSLYYRDLEKNKDHEFGLLLNSIKSVAFNKQGTKIIVHGEDKYEIFPVAEANEHKIKSQKKLIDYFRQRGVCKNLNA